MRASLFIGRMADGGAEKVLAMICNHLYENGWDVDIAMLLGAEVNRDHFNLYDKIGFTDLSPIKSNSYGKNVFFWLRKIRSYISNYKPDIIISFVGRINALVLTATIGMTIPVIVSERNDPKNDGRGRFLLKYCDLIYRRAKAIVFQTEYQKSCFASIHNTRSYIIPNPLHIINIPNIVIDNNLIVSVGRLHQNKNQSMLIKAMEIVKREVPNVRCEIYGEGILREELQSLIDNNQLQENVFLPGKKSNIIDYVAKANIFVLTSNREGLSNALLEAMMLEKVCITTNYEGADNIINNGNNGIIVPRNNPELLAKSIMNVLNDESGKFKEYGKNARQTVMGFESSIILRRWDDLIQKKCL